MELTILQRRRWDVLQDTLKQFRAAETSEQAWLELIFAISLLERFATEVDQESNHLKVRQVSEGSGLNEDGRRDASAADKQVANEGAPTTEPISAE